MTLVNHKLIAEKKLAKKPTENLPTGNLLKTTAPTKMEMQIMSSSPQIVPVGPPKPSEAIKIELKKQPVTPLTDPVELKKTTEAKEIETPKVSAIPKDVPAGFITQVTKIPVVNTAINCASDAYGKAKVKLSLFISKWA